MITCRLNFYGPLEEGIKGVHYYFLFFNVGASQASTHDRHVCYIMRHNQFLLVSLNSCQCHDFYVNVRLIKSGSNVCQVCEILYSAINIYITKATENP